MQHPIREIRAYFNLSEIRVYQAYSNEIADSALRNGRFVSPPFNLNRMTWIKPSFLWMMYRSGWAMKDEGQRRILAIDITHDGFSWALEHSCPSHPEPGVSEPDWRAQMDKSPARIQWDPERDLNLAPLPYRAIQIGLSGEAVQRYVSEWIVRISDVTSFVTQVRQQVLKGDLLQAQAMLPRERRYTIGSGGRPDIASEREWLSLTSHRDHEEIVRLLQDNPSNDSVPCLRSVIGLKPQLRHLDYDDYGAFYKKCLWALQDIGTPDARALIEECSHSDVPELRKEARYRLKRIAEGGRGGTQFPKTQE